MLSFQLKHNLNKLFTLCDQIYTTYFLTKQFSNDLWRTQAQNLMMELVEYIRECLQETTSVTPNFPEQFFRPYDDLKKRFRRFNRQIIYLFPDEGHPLLKRFQIILNELELLMTNKNTAD